MNKAIFKRAIKPVQAIALSFLALIVVGGLLLALPGASATGQSIGFVDSFFTATSATCVTGLAVLDTGSSFSLFGQIVILFLIQFGGLGFMTITGFFYLIMGKRITLRERMILGESINNDDAQTIFTVLRRIALVTLASELLGAIILSTRFIPMFGAGKGVFFSVFHSVSAFCNAGLDVFGMDSSLIPFSGDAVINLTIIALVVVGGLGFIVVTDVASKFRSRKKRLTLQSRLVLIVTAALIVLGAVAFYLLESENPATMGNMGEGEKILASVFQSVTPRTAGYSTISQAALTPVSKFLTLVLMFIGASPAGTGGGIKTTTFIVCLLFIGSIIRGRKEVNCFGKRFDAGTVGRAVAVTLLSLILIIVITALVILAEHQSEAFDFESVVFEVVSAFGTVGLSFGLTPMLSVASRILIIVTMYAGRIGMLTLSLSIARSMAADKNNIRFPEEKIMVG